MRRGAQAQAERRPIRAKGDVHAELGVAADAVALLPARTEALAARLAARWFRLAACAIVRHVSLDAAIHSFASDPLTDILRLTQATSVMAGGIAAGGRWAVHFPPPGEMKISLLAKRGPRAARRLRGPPRGRSAPARSGGSNTASGQLAVQVPFVASQIIFAASSVTPSAS
ncbi:hypothetical protein [Sorangium sp. So ce233]|uniref:hypothetical protein n=1 Tax=Sorangium sp. So ce233 TaxID=3133290 RepID=UPI003F644E0C